MPKETELESVARSLIQRHGAKAVQIARLRVETCERDGQSMAATIWQRIVEKIHEIRD